MKLTAKGRYAVTALADLAGRDGAPARLSDIAEAQALSQPFLEQLFAKLRKSGLVESVRGPGGGYRLARPLSDISISDVLDAVDEKVRATGCEQPARACTEVKGHCLSHPLWSALDDHIESFLGSVTLAHVVANELPQQAGRA